MKLKRSEKILASSALGLVGLAGLYFLFIAGDGRSIAQLNVDYDKLAAEIQSKDAVVKETERARKREADWQHRSLPAEPALADSLYQNWLGSLAERSKFHGLTLKSSKSTVQRGKLKSGYTRFTFKLNADARLGDLVDFLYGFYSVGYLHQITQFEIVPKDESHELKLSLTIEALSLPDAAAKTALPTGPGAELKPLADYRTPIVSRNLFAGFVRPVPPSPPRTAPPPRRDRGIDLAEYTVVTGFTEVDGRPQVWLQNRIAAQLWKLESGEGFTVGKVDGKIESINPDGEVVIQYDGHRRRLHDGDNLHGGQEIPGEKPAGADRGN